MEQYRGTTIISVRRDNQVSLGGDGQPQKKFAGFMTIKLLLGLQAEQLMLLLYLNALKKN